MTAQAISLDSRTTSTGQQATLGSLVGINSVLLSIALSGIMFPGGLAPYLGLGIMIGLISNGVINIVGALLTSEPSSLVIPQDKAGVILGGIGFGLGVLLINTPQDGPYLLSNYVAVICISGFVTGLVMYFAGKLGFGRRTQVLPYPVIGGFMAGSGVLMFQAAFVVVLDENPTIEALPTIFDPVNMLQWGLALVAAICLAIIMRKLTTPLVLPLTMGAASLVVYAGYYIFPDTITAAWFFSATPPISEQIGTLSFGALDLKTIVSFAPEIGIIALLTLLSGNLSIVAYGIGQRKDIALDKELEVNGIANMIASPFGIAAGHTSNSTSSMINEIGGRTRMIGVCSGIACLIAAVFVPQFTDKIPRILPAIGLFLFAVNYFYEWMWVQPRKWHQSERAISFGIVLALLATSFLVAIVAGLIFATLMFAVRYSRIPVYKNERSLSNAKSRTEWPPALRTILRTEGEGTKIISLHGFLFFGSVMNLVDQMRAYPKKITRVHYDFTDVTGADSSAMLAMSRLALIAQTKNILLSQSAMPEDLVPYLTIEDAAIYDTLDHAVHEFEHEILSDKLATSVPLKSGLTALSIPSVIQAEFKPLILKSGATLFNQGDQNGDIYYLESGSLVVVGKNGETVKILQPGVLVGEVARYAGFTRTATVKATTDAQLYCLTDEAINALSSDDKALLHETLANLLASRLSDLTRITASV